MQKCPTVANAFWSPIFRKENHSETSRDAVVSYILSSFRHKDLHDEIRHLLVEHLEYFTTSTLWFLEKDNFKS